MRILIELPTWLGDCVMATPAIENIINFFSNIEITFIGSFQSVEAMKYQPKVTRTVFLDRKYTKLYKTAKGLGYFDTFFSFRSSNRSRLLKVLISAKNKYQFNKNKYQHLHQVEKYNAFVNDSLKSNFSADRLVMYPKYSKLNIKSSKLRLLGINPGASYGIAKRWYPEKFAKVVIALSNQYDIFIFGGQGEIKIANDIELYLIEANVKNYRNLAGKTSITELINKISNLDLFITGDSGPMHIAAAFQIPTIAIFGPTNNNETSQWMNEKSIIVKKDLDCQPCMKRNCPLGHHHCMKLISANDVMDAVHSISID